MKTTLREQRGTIKQAIKSLNLELSRSKDLPPALRAELEEQAEALRDAIESLDRFEKVALFLKEALQNRVGVGCRLQKCKYPQVSCSTPLLRIVQEVER